MPIGSEGLSYRRYRVPREDRRVLVEPPLAQVDRTVRKNCAAARASELRRSGPAVAAS